MQFPVQPEGSCRAGILEPVLFYTAAAAVLFSVNILIYKEKLCTSPMAWNLRRILFDRQKNDGQTWFERGFTQGRLLL